MPYDNTNSGVLFKETDKKSEKAPDYKGTLNIGGKEKKLAGWIRESKAGKKFISLKLDDGSFQRKPAATEEEEF